MPYPNSQSPITLRLNKYFTDGGAKDRTELVTMLNDKKILIGTIAHRFGIAPSGGEIQHINDWPTDQLDLLRPVLIRAAMEGRQVAWDWQEAPFTRIDIIDFGPDQPIGITGRSPMVYPPYSTP